MPISILSWEPCKECDGFGEYFESYDVELICPVCKGTGVYRFGKDKYSWEMGDEKEH